MRTVADRPEPFGGPPGLVREGIREGISATSIASKASWADGGEPTGLVAPFPWYGTKRVPAAEIWARLGDVDHYIEPFAGTLSVLLARPGPLRRSAAETVNDADCLLANFWRAVRSDPDAVAEAADWPVNEADLHARHLWLANRGHEIAERVTWDPEFYDAQVAGWWVWGVSAWVGGGWCSGAGPWTPETLGLVPGRTAPAPQGPVGRLLGELVEYLVSERALAPGTIEGYRHYAQWFLSEYAPGPTTDGCGLDRLEVEQVTRFVLVDCCKLSVGATKNAVTALRVLMRFLFLEGYTPTCLVEAVPRAIPWRDSGRSRALAAEQVSRLLTSCDRRSSAGRRDFALLTLMARLGLRRGEVAALSLDDLDWRNGEVVVTGKGGRRDRLPLPCDVGEAIAGYCRHGRPRNGHRNLFLQVQAPYGPLTPGAVTLIPDFRSW